MGLSNGYHDVPPGKLAAVQTFLEMRTRPALRVGPNEPSWRVERFVQSDLPRYYALFHCVGDEHLWTLRLQMPQDEVVQLLSDPRYETYVLVTRDGDQGLLELDFRGRGRVRSQFIRRCAVARRQLLGETSWRSDRRWSVRIPSNVSGCTPARSIIPRQWPSTSDRASYHTNAPSRFSTIRGR